MILSRVRVVLLTLLVFLVSSFFSYHSESVSSAKVHNDTVRLHPPYKLVDDSWVDSVMHTLTEKERIAQLMIVAVYPEQGEDHYKKIEKLIEKHTIGGLIFFRGDPVTQAELTNRFQAKSKVPLMISMDGEWGLAMRLSNTIRYPRQMMLGAIQDNRLIYEMGEDIGEQCARMGIHINYAPVADVNNNANNPVINSRSFGEDRENVAAKAVAYMLGLQSKNIVATAKHFPGHGDTDIDSHHALPVLKHSWQRLDSIELAPFRKVINMGIGGVMVAHLHIPALDSTPDMATTLSVPVVTGLLRDSLEFDGIAITDAMNMKGISKYFKADEAAAKALVAGNDILLMPEDVSGAINAIKKEMEAGNSTWEEIDKKCRKILKLKYWTGLSHFQNIETKNLLADLNTNEYEMLKRKLIESSLTLLQNKGNIVPFIRLDTLRIASVAIGYGTNNTYQQTMDLYTDITHFAIHKDAEKTAFLELLDTLADFNLVIVGLHNTSMQANKNFGITPQSISFVDTLMGMQNVVLDIFANPYSLAYFKHLDKAMVLLMSYEDDHVTQSLSAQLLFGGITAKGKLPVTASHEYPVGTGIDTPQKIRLKYSLPEEVGVQSCDLLRIDSLVNNAIAKRATPGCQIVIIKDGVVFFHQSYGYHTYLKKRPVRNTDIYDLASITKIAATVPSVMHLYEEEEIDIKDKISKYLPYLDTTNKKDITIKDILAHNARLVSWIPFYVLTLEGFYLDEEVFSKAFSDTFPIQLAKDFYLNKNVKYKEGYFSHHYSAEYPIDITEKLYGKESFRDTIFTKIAASGLRNKNGYKYSDVGFYLLYQMIEKLTGTSFNIYVRDKYYKPLGATTLGYWPLKRFSPDRIPSTENDIVFRKQVVHGYVHDPGAAMLGGVCGHAGVFSNANDLAKLMQMYLLGGEYGGIQYFKKSTLDLFTSRPYYKEDNRRGLGFDKPQIKENSNGPTCKSMSAKSFGHSGFTGTYAWADPETNTVYIFLSNRCHPDAENNKLLDMNVRTNIQQVIMEAVGEGTGQ